jgi:WhiB family redox-sensing transcriptional regulator
MADVVRLLPRWIQQEWMENAACRGLTHLFFPPHGEQAEAREAREAVARTVCRECMVLVECRAFAREHREQGFWGGENEDERRAARRRRAGLHSAAG